MTKYIKKNSLIFSFVLVAVFMGLFMLSVDYLQSFGLSEASWRIINGLQRLIFGIIEVYLFVWLFNKKSWREVIHTKGFGKGMLAGCVILLLTAEYILDFILGNAKFSEMTTPLLLGIVLQQITTGLWEEITFRAFLIEGLMSKIGDRWYGRLSCGVIIACIFGGMHMLDAESASQALFRFAITGAMGLAFAAVYIYSHNILAAMVLHAIYDIPANLTGYAVGFEMHPVRIVLQKIFYPSYMIAAVAAVVFIIISKPWNDKEAVKECKRKETIRAID